MDGLDLSTTQVSKENKPKDINFTAGTTAPTTVNKHDDEIGFWSKFARGEDSFSSSCLPVAQSRGGRGYA